MKKYLSVLLVSLAIFLVSCSNLTFVSKFTKSVEVYKTEPTEKNLREIAELVTKSNKELNEQEKETVEKGLDIIRQTAITNGITTQSYWEEVIGDISNSLIEKGFSFRDSTEEVENTTI